MQKFDTKKYIDDLQCEGQEGPHLGNQYTEDSALTDYIQQIIPQDILQQAEKSLIDLGDKVINVIHQASLDCEKTQPRLQTIDAFGKKISSLHTGWGWKQQKIHAAQEGIVALSFETDITGANYLQYRRFIQLVRLYLYIPSSGMFGCPLAMTDGMATICKQILLQPSKIPPKSLQKVGEIFQRIISRDPSQFYTSGQWMTEKKGGSDLNQTTETIAIPYKNNTKYHLFGYKYFCSAADSDVALILARIIDPGQDYSRDQIRKLPISLFVTKLNKRNGQHNGMQLISLKDKLGTRQLPTAEILLNGCRAYLISEVGKGIKDSAAMLNVTRLYTAGTAVGYMRRMLALARDYADRRQVFGQKLNQIPMQIRILSDLEVIFRGSLIFFLKTSEYYSKIVANSASLDEQNLFRLSTPLLKLFAAKEGMKVNSEVVEFFGGIGYCENSNIPVYLRDGQTLTIWEGTTNVLCMDFYRAINTKPSAFQSYIKFVSKIFINNTISEAKLFSNSRIQQSITLNTLKYNELVTDVDRLLKHKEMFVNLQFFLRDVSLGAARILIAAYLLDHFMKTGKDKDLEIYLRWVNIEPLYAADIQIDQAQNKTIALDRSVDGTIKGVGDIDSRGKIRPRY